jgi:hypothetical protein
MIGLYKIQTSRGKQLVLSSDEVFHSDEAAIASGKRSVRAGERLEVWKGDRLIYDGLEPMPAVVIEQRGAA